MHARKKCAFFTSLIVLSYFKFTRLNIGMKTINIFSFTLEQCITHE